MAVCTWRNVTNVLTLFVLFGTIFAKKHTQTFKEDSRSQITLTTFGFVTGGYLFVNVTRLVIHPLDESDSNGKFGFTLDRSLTNGASPLLDDQTNTCRLNKSSLNASIVYFVIDFAGKALLIDRSQGDLRNLSITLESAPFDDASNNSFRTRRHLNRLSDAYLLRRHQRDVQSSELLKKDELASLQLSSKSQELRSIPIEKEGSAMLSFQFLVRITRPEEQGRYNFLFHNCLRQRINMTITIEEKNPGSYLSIGQQSLPLMFFLFCVVYVLVGSFWLWFLCYSKGGVFKIHYLMLALLYIKALAMLFHGVNFYFISVEGHQEEAFAILYYIMYLVKGIFMFVTIVLIGAGWTFVKHVLSDRDKKIFVVVIPLQVLANVATIIIEESDEGMLYYVMLNNVFLIVDLVCCGAILFPVIWSIRHLQQASQIDGKVAMNLQKLKIFRHFYILVVCYIYFTRIIVMLVRIAVQYQYEWLDPLLVELATLAFYILTGYKFRPASNNPYLQLSQSDDEGEMEEVVTKSGALDSVKKVNIKVRTTQQTTEFGETVKQRENSHEYD